MTAVGAFLVGILTVSAAVSLAAEQSQRPISWEALVAAAAAVAAAYLTYRARKDAGKVAQLKVVIDGYDDLVHNLQGTVTGMRAELTATRVDLNQAKEDTHACEARSAVQASEIVALRRRIYRLEAGSFGVDDPGAYG